MRLAEAALVGSRRHVQQVDPALQLLRDGHALVQVVAAVEELRAAHAELNREARAHLGTDRVEHLAGKAATVLQAAAVLVLAVVEVRREELVDEPTVPTVDHEHAEPGALGEPRHVPVSRRDLVELLDRQRADLHPVGARARRGAPLAHAVLAGLVGHVRARVHAGMRELKARDRAVAVDGVGRVGGRRERVQDGLVEVVGVAAVGGGMHHALRDRDRRRAAPGAQLIEGRRLRPDAAVVRDVGPAHRRREHAVGKSLAGDGDGRAQVRVLGNEGGAGHTTPLTMMAREAYSQVITMSMLTCSSQHVIAVR